MGKGKNWRVVHPDMGSKQLTLNHGVHAPGQEFTQHYHDASEDAIVVLEGGGAIRQGAVYTPIAAGDVIFVPAGEVHGTVNTTPNMARLISFQAPPDMALYRGERDTPNTAPTPQEGHRSNVPSHQYGAQWSCFWEIHRLAKCRLSAERLCTPLLRLHLSQRQVKSFAHEPIDSESIYVLRDGSAEVTTDAGETSALERHDVLFLSPWRRLFTLSSRGWTRGDHIVLGSCRFRELKAFNRIAVSNEKNGY